jgi:surface antigen
LSDLGKQDKTMNKGRGNFTVAAAALATAVLLAAPAHALGPQDGLKNTPGSKFNDADIALMRARVVEALKSDKEGEVLEWKNDKTGSSGSVVPMNRLSWNGMDCRRLRIANAHADLKAQGVYKFCDKDGKWKLVGPEKE